MIDNIPPLRIEVIAKGELSDHVVLDQLDNEDGLVQAIKLHPVHIRHMLELIRKNEKQSDALRSAIQPQTFAQLEGRLLALATRIEFLHNYLCNHSDTRHADFTYEQTYSRATLDIAIQFCKDLGFELDEEPETKST